MARGSYLESFKTYKAVIDEKIAKKQHTRPYKGPMGTTP